LMCLTPSGFLVPFFTLVFCLVLDQKEFKDDMLEVHCRLPLWCIGASFLCGTKISTHSWSFWTCMISWGWPTSWLSLLLASGNVTKIQHEIFSVSVCL
jgi:hypothetical protein